MGITSRGFIGLVLLLLTFTIVRAENSFMRNAKISTRIVQTRYGRLQGLLVPMDPQRFLKPIEVRKLTQKWVAKVDISRESNDFGSWFFFGAEVLVKHSVFP